MARLGGLGEFEVIDLFRRATGDPPGGLGIGDDCAVLQVGAPSPLLVTTDMLLEGIHFLRSEATLWQVGWKTMASNVSDIAAMGGRPEAAFLSVGLPPGLSRRDLLSLRDGLMDCCREYGVVLSGGDTVSSPSGLALNVALLGSAVWGRVLYRKDARPGQVVCVGRDLGGSAAGLHLVLHGRDGVPPEVAEAVLERHLVPRPQVDLGRLLAQWEGVGGVIDVSDGLLADLGHVAEASGVDVEIASERVPVQPQARAVAEVVGHDPLDWALTGGEEYCLAFTVDELQVEALAKAARDRLGLELYVVGQTAVGQGRVLVDGRKPKKMGWDHFQDE